MAIKNWLVSFAMAVRGALGWKRALLVAVVTYVTSWGDWVVQRSVDVIPHWLFLELHNIPGWVMGITVGSFLLAFIMALHVRALVEPKLLIGDSLGRRERNVHLADRVEKTVRLFASVTNGCSNKTIEREATFVEVFYEDGDSMMPKLPLEEDRAALDAGEERRILVVSSEVSNPDGMLVVHHKDADRVDMLPVTKCRIKITAQGNNVPTNQREFLVFLDGGDIKWRLAK